LPIDDEINGPTATTVSTPQSCFFWISSADGWLRILRCERCGFWVHPPLPQCPTCHTRPLEPTPVSGEGWISELTVVAKTSIDPRQASATVELAEQSGLRVAARVVISESEALRVGSAVRLDPDSDRPRTVPVFVQTSLDRT
jgi:uncharacterized OB-fold protein